MRGRDPVSGRLVSVESDYDKLVAKHPSEFSSWRNINRRCSDPAYQQWKDYGGRGIRVCDRWRESFANFLADMGPRPSREHSIDRIDNSKNYEPTNCRWATRVEQMRNMRRNRWIEFRGETLLISDWAKRLNVPCHTITMRLSRGWSVERALSHSASGRKPVPVEGRTS